MNHNIMISTNIVMTIFLMLGISYNYHYDSFPIQIEFLGNLGFWLTLPLSIIIIVLSIWLLIKKVGIVSSLLSLFIAGIILFIAICTLFHWHTP
ncbi:hypothetical protein [Lysinibacillus cavernae]|uniref:hypothetical protein n=1 Tax=Lysinibacillus cavernae TaxID=2666135 RepID=UPI001E350F74|nr:hypothetical protein [Lysinibacillus cavernae]